MIRRYIPVLLCYLTFLTLLSSPVPAGAEQAKTPGKDPTTLAEHYRRALRIDPGNLTLHYFLGISLLTDNRVEEALSELRQAYPAFADSIEMNYNLGLAYFLAGDPDSALLHFDQAETLGAGDHPELYPLPEAYYNLGIAYLEKDSLDEAAHALEKSLNLDPTRDEIHRMLGDLFARQGKIERALQEFAAFLERHPDDRAASEYVYALHFNRAQKHLESEDFIAAREELSQALAVSPDSPLALYYLGFLDYRQGHYQQAVSYLSRAGLDADDEVQQNIRAILYNCSLALLEAGRARDALAAIAPLIEKKQAGVKEYYLAGNIHLALQEYYQAHSRYQDVLTLEPEHRGATVNLVATAAGAIDELVAKGQSLYHEGRLAEALASFEEALAMNSAEPRVRSYLKEIRSELRQRSTALFDDAEKTEQAGELRLALKQTREGLSLAPGDNRGVLLERRILDTMQQELERSITEADSLLAKNLLSDAEKLFAQVLKLDPDNTTALEGREEVEVRRREGVLQATTRGNKALEEGRLDEARSAFEETLRLQPDSAAGRDGLTKISALLDTMIAEELQWGRRAKSGGDLTQARNHFSKALQLRDDQEIRAELIALDQMQTEKIEALLAAADQALDRSDFHHARRYYRQVLEQEPSHPVAAEGLAEVEKRSAAAIQEGLVVAEKHLEKKKFEQALKGYRKVLDLDPANKKALAGLERGRTALQNELKKLAFDGAEALEQGRFDAAKTAFEKVLLLDPYHQAARQGLDRIEQFKLTGDKPGDEQRLYLRGIELYTRGRYEEAVATWKRVLFLSPDHEKALMNIEKAQRKLRQIKEYRNG